MTHGTSTLLRIPFTCTMSRIGLITKPKHWSSGIWWQIKASLHAAGLDALLQSAVTSTWDFAMVAPAGLEPCRPRAMADCAARLSSTLVAPTLSTMLWIPLLTTSYSGSTAWVTTGPAGLVHGNDLCGL